VRERLLEAKDRLSDSSYLVGFFHYRMRWYPGAIDRLQSVIKEDPEYTRRDAAYFYLGEALVNSNRQAEALPYYERLVAEFEQSEHMEEAQKRIAELKAATQAKSP
jgi:TolA-binding protein